jgi:hypothetical protein
MLLVYYHTVPVNVQGRYVIARYQAVSQICSTGMLGSHYKNVPVNVQNLYVLHAVRLYR